MFTSFGYFEDKKEDKLVLEYIFSSLQRGGVFLVELMGKERLEKILQLPTCLKKMNRRIGAHADAGCMTVRRDSRAVSRIEKSRVITEKFGDLGCLRLIRHGGLPKRSFHARGRPFELLSKCVRQRPYL